MKTVVALLLAALLAACSHLQEQPLTLDEHLQKREVDKGEPVKRINRFMLGNYQYIDARHMIVSVGASREYLLEFAFDCHELEHAHTLEVKALGIGLSPMDSFSGTSSTGNRVRCPVKTIYPLITTKADAEN